MKVSMQTIAEWMRGKEEDTRESNNWYMSYIRVIQTLVHLDSFIG